MLSTCSDAVVGNWMNLVIILKASLRYYVGARMPLHEKSLFHNSTFPFVKSTSMHIIRRSIPYIDMSFHIRFFHIMTFHILFINFNHYNLRQDQQNDARSQAFLFQHNASTKTTSLFILSSSRHIHGLVRGRRKLSMTAGQAYTPILWQGWL